MRREKLIEAVQEILADLKDTGISAMFAKVIESDRATKSENSSRTTWFDIQSVTDYLARTSRYDEQKKKILHILRLSDLSNPRVWQDVIVEPGRAFVFDSFRSIKNAEDIIPQILELISFDTERAIDAFSGGRFDVELQKVILTDEGEAFSSPDRLILLLQSVRDLYSAIARIEGLAEESLAVVRLDSGSEKSFDFLGLAKVMEHLRDILNLSYSVIAFHKQNVTIKNLEVASQGLEIVEKINKLEKDGALTSEEAMRAKHSLFKAALQFSESGAYTPDMIIQAPLPALVMKPTQQFLTPPVGSSNSTSEPTSHVEQMLTSDEGGQAPEPEFSKDELEAVARALRQARKESGVKGEGPGSAEAVRKPNRKRPTTAD